MVAMTIVLSEQDHMHIRAIPTFSLESAANPSDSITAHKLVKIDIE